MTEILQQKIKDEILKLPKVKQDAINSIDWIKKVEEIGKIFGLIDEEVEKLQLETGLILSGLVNLNDLPYDIQNRIGLNESDTQKIIDELFQKVFDPIAFVITNDIKNNLENKKTRWDQAVNFIVGGADYSVFLEK